MTLGVDWLHLSRQRQYHWVIMDAGKYRDGLLKDTQGHSIIGCRYFCRLTWLDRFFVIRCRSAATRCLYLSQYHCLIRGVGEHEYCLLRRTLLYHPKIMGRFVEGHRIWCNGWSR